MALFIVPPAHSKLITALESIVRVSADHIGGTFVRFESLAEIGACQNDVRFTSKSEH